eukprot:jgi/Orpsp1_1/1191324/evm.model.d7180000084972.1
MSSCKYNKLVYQTCINNNGKLINYEERLTSVPKYCNNISPENLTSTGKYYILTSIDASATYPEIKKGNDTIIIKADQYSVTQITTTKNGLCIDKSNNVLVSNDKCNGSNLIKYYCSSICKTCTTEYIKNENYNPDAEISS